MASVLTSARKSANARMKGVRAAEERKKKYNWKEREEKKKKGEAERLKKAAEARAKAETEKKAGESRKGWLSYRNLGKGIGAKPDIKEGDTEVTKRAKEKDAFRGKAIEGGARLLDTKYKEYRQKKAAKKVLAFKAEQAAAKRREDRGLERRAASRSRKALKYRGRLSLLKNL